MACNNPDINLPLGIGNVNVAIETLSTALSLITAIVYYNKWKEDKDNLERLSDQYVAIGEEYCEAADTHRLNTNRYYEYVTQFPDYVYTGVPAQQKFYGALGDFSDQADAAFFATPSDDPGRLCQASTAVAAGAAEAASAAWAEGTLWERRMEDKYLASHLQARTNAVNSSTPNLASSFQLVGDTVSNSAQANFSAFSSAAYVAGRGIGRMFNNRNSQPSVGYY